MKAIDLNKKLPYAFGNEIEYLQELGKILPEASIIVMLGIGPAVLGLALLEGTQHSVIFYGVDNKEFSGVEHVRPAGYKIVPLIMLSDKAANRFENETVDLLIVDACHTEECVERDIMAWGSKIKPGGIVFFHDYVPHENDDPGNGVKAAVDRNMTVFWKEIARPGISIVFEKI